MKNIWKITGSYRLADTEKLDESAVWYIMDEFGTSIQHSDNPNVKVVPFLFAPNNKMDDQVNSYSLCWNVKNLETGDCVFRNYLGNLDEKRQRSSRLYVWF